MSTHDTSLYHSNRTTIIVEYLIRIESLDIGDRDALHHLDSVLTMHVGLEHVRYVKYGGVGPVEIVQAINGLELEFIIDTGSILIPS